VTPHGHAGTGDADIMNLARLRVFQQVVLHGGVSLAARHLGVSQPAVSRQLGQLERDCGAKLYDKRRGALVLTPQGRAVCEAACRVLGELEALHQQLGNLDESPRGRLTIGCGQLTARCVLPTVVAECLARFPKLTVSVFETDSADVFHLLRTGVINVGVFTKLAEYRQSVFFERLFADRIVCACSEQSPFARKSVVRPADLATVPLVTYSAGSPIRKALDRTLPKGRVSPLVQTRNAETMLAYVQRQIAVALVPSYIGISRPAGVLMRPLSVRVPLEYGVYYDTACRELGAIRAFASLMHAQCRTQFADLVAAAAKT
jgi:DNA-binding transcriptional LysR family regulator